MGMLVHCPNCRHVFDRDLNADAGTTDPFPVRRDKSLIDSPAIKRLVEEVKVKKTDDEEYHGYNRTYHRHNR